MADILIQMDMPQHCFNCSTKIDPDNRRCNIDGHVFEETLSKLTCRRDEHCPLIELPKHGDLVSKDDVMNAILGEPPEAHYPSWYASIVNEIPAIVPSNKEETE